MDPNPPRTVEVSTILNWNANGLASQRSTLIAFLARYRIDIACITETHLTEGEIFKLPGYRVYRKDRNAIVASGEVAIIIKHKIYHNPIADPTNVTLETIGIEVK